MIAHVRGRVTALAPESAVVEVGSAAAAVGLLVLCAPSTLAPLRVGEQATLATALVVREDSLTLFGFADDDERSLFELLQTASGVGPRLAQAVLAVLRPVEVRRAIATEDLGTLTRVPGIGRKGAQRIVLELKDRVGAVDDSGDVPPLPPGAADGPTTAAWRLQLHGAITSLGWSGGEADAAVDALAADVESGGSDAPTPDVGVLLRRALASLGPR